ncbi:MAG: hypothetical protein WBU20_09790, partial [Candidatus Acidiferrum sp.]
MDLLTTARMAQCNTAMSSDPHDGFAIEILGPLRRMPRVERPRILIEQFAQFFQSLFVRFRDSLAITLP